MIEVDHQGLFNGVQLIAQPVQFFVQGLCTVIAQVFVLVVELVLKPRLICFQLLDAFGLGFGGFPA